MHPGRSFAEKGQMGAESNKMSMDKSMLILHF